MSRPAGNQRGNILVSALILFASIGASVGLVEISPIVHTDSMFAAAELPKAPKGGGGKECGEKPPEGKKNSKKKTKSEWKTCIEQKCDAGKKSPQVSTCPNTSDSLCKQYCFELVSKDGKIQNCCQFTEQGNGCTKVDGKCGGKQATGAGGGGSPPGGGGGGGGGGDKKPTKEDVKDMQDGIQNTKDRLAEAEENKRLQEAMGNPDGATVEQAKIDKLNEQLNSQESSLREIERAAGPENLDTIAEEGRLNENDRIDMEERLAVDQKALSDLKAQQAAFDESNAAMGGAGEPFPKQAEIDRLEKDIAAQEASLKEMKSPLNTFGSPWNANSNDPDSELGSLAGGTGNEPNPAPEGYKPPNGVWDPYETGNENTAYKPPEGPWDPYETGKGETPPERRLAEVNDALNSCAAPGCSNERFNELADERDRLRNELGMNSEPPAPVQKTKLEDVSERLGGIEKQIKELYPDGPPSPGKQDMIYANLQAGKAQLEAEKAALEAEQSAKYDKDLWDEVQKSGEPGYKPPEGPWDPYETGKGGDPAGKSEPPPGEPGYKPPEGPWDPYETGKGGDPAGKSEPPPKPEPGPGVKPPPGPKTPEIPMPRPRPAGADAPPAPPGPGQQPPGGGEKPPGGGSPPPMPQPPGGGNQQKPPSGPTNPNQNQNCPIYMALLGGCSNTAQCTITVSPTTVQAGNPVTLSWQSPPNSVSANISNIGTVPPSGSQVIYPQANTSYSMTVAVNSPYNGSQAVTNQYNYISCNTQVSVTPKTQSTPYGTGTNGQPCAQPPTQPPAGSCSVGAWQPQYSNGCLAGWQCVQNTGCPNQPPQPEASSCKDSTWKPIYGTTNTACILGWQCNGTSTTTPPVGTTTPPVASTTPPTARISCQPQLLDVGMTLAISFACTDSTESTGTGFSTNGELSGSTTTVISALPAGSNTATYGITCAQGSATAGAQCAVQVAKPSIILVANPKKVKSGSAATLGWVTSGMKSCTISSAELPFFTEANKDNTSVNGMASTSPLTATSNFLLSCTTAAGGSRSATTTVTVEP